jgi:hypothetical protein
MLASMRARLSLFLFSLAISSAALAQSGVGVELDEITDNRVSEGDVVGSCELKLKLTGNGIDKAAAARVLVKEARDDQGNDLKEDPISSDFTPRDYNNGSLQVGMNIPARSASSVRVKGTVELFVPTRDPNAIVKIDKALAKLDAPLASKSLKASKVEVTLLSPGGYKTLMQSRKITEKDIAAIREEGKKRGVSEKEIEAMIGFAQAMDSMDADVPDGAVILSGTKAAFDRIYRVEILGADGKPLDVNSRSTSTRGENTIMMLQPNSPPPAGAALQIYLVTDKSRMSFPFEVSVPLP